MTKVLVCGGRKYNDMKRIFEVLDNLHLQYGITTVVNGGQSGADALACLWADRRGVPKSTHYANWDVYGNDAGPIRNQLMLELHPDISLVVAFPGNNGTKNMTDLAKAHNKTILEIDKVLKSL